MRGGRGKDGWVDGAVMGRGKGGWRGMDKMRGKRRERERVKIKGESVRGRKRRADMVPVGVASSD